MKSRLLHGGDGLKTFALVFEKDEEVKEALLRFAAETNPRVASPFEYALSAKGAALTSKPGVTPQDNTVRKHQR